MPGLLWKIRKVIPSFPIVSSFILDLKSIELDGARADSATPVVDAHGIIKHYLRLSTLYGNVGNTVAEILTSEEGFNLVRKNPLLYSRIPTPCYVTSLPYEWLKRSDMPQKKTMSMRLRKSGMLQQLLKNPTEIDDLMKPGISSWI